MYASKNFHKHQKRSQLSARAFQDRKGNGCFKKRLQPSTKNIHNSLQEHFKSEKRMHAYKNIQNQHNERSQLSARAFQDRKGNVAMLHKTFTTTKNVHNSLQEHFKTEKCMHASKNVQNYQKHSQLAARAFQVRKGNACLQKRSKPAH